MVDGNQWQGSFRYYIHLIPLPPYFEDIWIIYFLSLHIFFYKDWGNAGLCRLTPKVTIFSEKSQSLFLSKYNAVSLGRSKNTRKNTSFAIRGKKVFFSGPRQLRTSHQRLCDVAYHSSIHRLSNWTNSWFKTNFQLWIHHDIKHQLHHSCVNKGFSTKHTHTSFSLTFVSYAKWALNNSDSCEEEWIFSMYIILLYSRQRATAKVHTLSSNNN